MVLVFLALFAPTPGYAVAGGVYFLGTVTTVGSSTLYPGQVTLDRHGNLWAVSTANNSVVEWNGTGWTTVISGLSSPFGLAFDSSNNLFMSQTGVAGVYKYPAPSYSSGTLLTPSFNSPVYLAFDGNDNLFVADNGNNAVYELLASGSYGTATAVVSAGLSAPSGIALDLSGNLFVADTGNSEVKEYTASSSYTTEATIASVLNSPMGIAVDPGGNVYVSEYTNGKLDLITAKSGYLAREVIYTNPSGFGSLGMVVGTGGVLYEGDYGGGATYEFTPGAVNFGTLAVGSAAGTVTVTFSPSLSLDTVHAVVLTTGETGHDFTLNNSTPGTCGSASAPGSLVGGQPCTVIVNFAATAPGLRTGAVELLNSEGLILATGFVYGTGTAPLAAFSPGLVSPVSMGSLSPALSAPSNPAWRVDGNLFFTDGTSTGRVIQIAPGSGSPSVVSLGNYTLNTPNGVAIDGAGNIFVSDAGDNRVLRIPASGTASVVILTSYGIGNIGQVAVDPAGAVYVGDGANGRIVVAPPTGNVYTLPISGVDLDTPAGLAVDANYNLYIADAGANKIFKVTNGVATTIDTSSLSPALSAPSSLTLDDNGTLYVSDTGNNRIVIVPQSGTPTVLAYDYTTPLSGPKGVVFDLAGQMYIADSGNNAIMQYDWTTSVYGFADTPVGSLSSDSPASFFFFNLGNSPLSIEIPDMGNNPSITNNAFSLGTGTNCPELTASSGAPGTLAALAGCTLTFDFQPTATGYTQDEVPYIDNSLNVTGTNSVVVVYGTGTSAGDTTTVTFAALPAALYSTQSATVSVTVADSTTPASIPTGSVSFTDSIQGSLGSATINGSGVASLGSVTFTGAGTHTITASYAGVSGSFAASSNTASISVTQAPVATVTPPAALNLGQTQVGQSSSTQTVTFTIAATGVLGSTKVLSLGASSKGAPFKENDGSTCIPTTPSEIYTSSSTCTVRVYFKPVYPGVQYGAVEILDQSNNVLATAYIYATGTGPEAATLPGTPASVTYSGYTAFNGPWSMAFDGSGNLYFGNQEGGQVYEVPSGGGAATLFAGTGTAGYSGDGGPATSAELSAAWDVALDGAGNVYIADFGNNTVRMVSAATGFISTVAGNLTGGYSGDGGAATSAKLDGVSGLALDGEGNLYIADLYNNAIRKVTKATGIITTVAGDGTQGYSGDGGLATQAHLNGPNSMVVDGAGNLYIADKGNNRIRMVSASTGFISTVAGNGASSDSDSGDGGPATQAVISGPLAVAVDAAGNLTIVDSNAAIRVVFAATGIIETDSVNVGVPVMLREDGAGNLYTADTFFGGLYIVSPTTSFTYPTTTTVGTSDTTDGPVTALLLNIGNTPLSAVGPGLTEATDFTQIAGPGTPADCTASFSLVTGAACTLNIEFEPTVSGSLSESLVITDNSLYNPPATQNIGLVGTALPAQATLVVTGVPGDPQPYGTNFAVGSSGGSGTGAVTFSVSGVCSLSGTSVTITAGSGICYVTAMKASDGTYAAATSAPAPVGATLGVQTPLVVTGVPAPAQIYGSTFTVGATGGSGTGAVTFSTNNICSVTGTTVTMISGTGVCSVTATKASDGTNAATTSDPATVSARVAPQATLTVTGVPTTAQPYGTTFTIGTAGGSGTGVVTFTYSGSCTISGTTVTINSGSGTCSVTANKARDGNYDSTTSATVTVAATLASQLALVVTGVPGVTQHLGSTFTVGSSGGSGTGAVTFSASGVCSVAGTAVTITSGSGTCSVTATKASDGNFAAQTSAAATVAAALITQTINFAALPSVVVYPAAPIALSATGGASGQPIVFSVVSGPASISGSTLTLTGAGTVVVAANQAGSGGYAPAAQVTQSLLSSSVTLATNVSALSFGAQTLGVTSPAQTVIVNNPSAFAAPLTSAIASGDFTATLNCPSIPADGNCSVGVTFTPTATGARTGTLTVITPYSPTPTTVALTGTGAAAGIATSPANLVFGSQLLETTSTGLALGIQNTGTAALAISNVATTGDFITTGNCATIPAGTNCTLTVTFTPSATGSRTGTVTLTDNAGGGTATQTIQLSGSGTEAGTALSTSSETFPGTLVGATSPALTATLTNSGTSSLTAIALSVQGDFAQSNTCGATLAAGASCNISITYSPTIAGAETGSLNTSDSLGTQSIVLNGTGLTPGASLNASQLLFGGQLVGATSQAQTVVFTNTGSGAATFSSIALPANFTDTTNCAGSIAAGASCSINVFFTPSTTGALSGNLTLTDTAGTQTVSLAGVGVSAVLSITPSFELFGSQQQGTVSQAQSLQVANNGSNAITLGSVAVTNNFVESDSCSGSTLAAGGNCSIAVGFAPSAAGTISGSLTVASADNTVSTVAALQGQGAGAGVSIQPALVSFGSQTVGIASGAQVVTVWNTGSTAFSIGAVKASGDFSETDTCAGQTIAAGANCVFSITMTPTTQGTRTGTIQFVESIDGLQIVSLSGVGQAPGIGLSTNVLAFGSLSIVAPAQAGTAAGTSQSVVVTNSGEGVLSFSSIQTVGDFRETDTCGVPIAAAATCNLTVTFVPTALGHRTGTLILTSNAGGQQVVSLAGDGSPVGLILTPPILNFGLQTVGVNSAPLTAVLSNNTGHAITQMAVSASGEYAETDNCGVTLANASSCTLEITVLPTTSGAITGAISVSSGGVIVLGAQKVGHKDRDGLGEPENLARAKAETVANGNSNSNIGTVATRATTVPSIARVARLAFGAPPAAAITAGGNAGSSITVIEEDTNGNTISATDTITLAVTGPGGYSKSYTSAAASGTAIFNLGGKALTTSGIYAYSAAISTNAVVTAANAQESVSPGIAAAVNAGSGTGQTTTIDAAFALPLTAQVVDTYGNAVSGVTVTFTAPASGAAAALSAASAVTNSSGAATVTAMANGTAGSYAIAAAVSGATAGSFLLTNGKASPTVTVTANSNPVLAGTAVTFSATVSSTLGSPSGSVTFMDGSTSLGSTALAFGTASITAAALVEGAHSVTAVYSGNTNFATVTSAPVTESVLDFTLTSTPTASPAVNVGQSVTYALTIQPNQGNSLPAATTLTIAGLPANAAASLSLSPWTQLSSTSWQLPSGTTYASIPLLVTTSAVTTAANHPPAGLSSGPGWPQLAVGVLLLPLAFRLRRAKGKFHAAARWLVLFAAALAVNALSGCGGGHGFFAQPPQTYTLTVTATAGTLTHSTNVTLTIE